MTDAENPRIILRSATAADRGELERMVRAYYAFDGHTFDPESHGRAINLVCMEDPMALGFIVEADGKIAGYVIVTLGFSIEYGGRDGFIDEVWLEPAFQGRGLGGRVMELAEQAARTAGVGHLHLEVQRHNTRARALYEKRGYEAHDRFLMTKRLV